MKLLYLFLFVIVLTLLPDRGCAQWVKNEADCNTNGGFCVWAIVSGCKGLKHIGTCSFWKYCCKR